MFGRYFKERFRDSCLSKHRFYLGMSAIDLAREAVGLKLAAMPKIRIKSSCPSLTEIPSVS